MVPVGVGRARAVIIPLVTAVALGAVLGAMAGVGVTVGIRSKGFATSVGVVAVKVPTALCDAAGVVVFVIAASDGVVGVTKRDTVAVGVKVAVGVSTGRTGRPERVRSGGGRRGPSAWATTTGCTCRVAIDAIVGAARAWRRGRRVGCTPNGPSSSTIANRTDTIVRASVRNLDTDSRNKLLPTALNYGNQSVNRPKRH